MPGFLVLVLEAPLAALGDVAVGERRYGTDRPAKSAVLGLLAAALGIERHEEEAHRRLSEGYGYAVRVDAAGDLLQDFHTAQVPPARRGRRWATRREELAEAELETILSLREYRETVRHTVALWETGEPFAPLDALAEAIRRPRFVLYHGRRACPLGRPPAPLVVEADSLAAALERYDRDEALARAQLGRFAGAAGGRRDARIYADLDIAERLGGGLRVDRLLRRRDLLLSRGRWQFGLRDELVAVPAGEAR